MGAERIDIKAIGAAGAELARYRISSGERVVMGWRRSGGIEVTDRPLQGRHSAFVVDRGFRSLEQLTAFVGEYLEHAVRVDACPMSGEAIGAMLECTEHEALAPLLGEGS